MVTLAVLFAAAVVAGEPTHRSSHPAAHSEAKATQHAAEQERKLIEQAMHRQFEEEKRLAHAEQRSVHDQMKTQIEAQALARSQHPEGLPGLTARSNAAGFAGRPYATANRSYDGGSHHSYRHPGHHYRHYQTWPMGQDPELAGLHALKQSLDNVHPGLTSSVTHRQAIERALLQVVEVSRPPSVGSIDRLAGHLATALASRDAGPIDTSAIALALRGGVNAPYLINAERAEVQRELQTALQHGKVRSAEISTVVAALQNVEHQEQVHR